MSDDAMMVPSDKLSDEGLSRRALLLPGIAGGVTGAGVAFGAGVAAAGVWWGVVVMVFAAVALVLMCVYLFSYRRRLVAAQNGQDQAGSAARWDAAVAVAHGVDDVGSADREARYRSSRRLIMVMALIGLAIAALFVALGIVTAVAGDSDGTSLRPLGFIVSGVGFAVLFGVRTLSRSGPVRLDRARLPSGPLNTSERLSAMRQIRQQDPVNVARLPVLIAMARYIEQDSRLIPSLAAGLYLLVTVTWTLAQRMILRRRFPAEPTTDHGQYR